ncbi:hypothetical protein FLLO111716_11605 [Flavobacterium longum]|uniref:RCC1 domain-containing protein n=1 Tax=Flavobacterium longum TaxID=1299340 RepID=UPI0039E8D854
MRNLVKLLPFFALMFFGCSSDETNSPDPEPEALYWKEVYPGWQHTTAMRSDGTLWGWGQNYWGQLGVGSTTPAEFHTPIQISTDTDWNKVAVGTAHTLAIKSNGTLWGWGINSNGELGDGTGVAKYTPTQIGTENDWAAVSAGNGHSMALKSDGSLWVWGGNSHGQIGYGEIDDEVLSPQQVGTDTDWVKIKAGEVASLALKSDGSLWLWGAKPGTAIQLMVPTQVGSDSSWNSFSIGSNSLIAVKSTGVRWGIGHNYSLGAGEGDIHSTLTQIGTDSGWQQISSGNWHKIGLKTDGTIWTWGENSDSQLGNGASEDSGFPVQIGIGSTWDYIATAPMGRHSVARKTDKTLWAFGWNLAGQLGNGTETNSNVPVLIPCPQ